MSEPAPFPYTDTIKVSGSSIKISEICNTYGEAGTGGKDRKSSPLSSVSQGVQRGTKHKT